MTCIELLKLLSKILIFSLKSSIADTDIVLKRTFVFEHHSVYIELYGFTLKLKNHFSLHYLMVMKKVGLLKPSWTMRLEGKHRPPIIYAKVTCNQIILSYSVALTNQLHLSDVIKAKLFTAKPISSKVSAKTRAFLKKIWFQR